MSMLNYLVPKQLLDCPPPTLMGYLHIILFMIDKWHF